MTIATENEHTLMKTIVSISPHKNQTNRKKKDR